MFYIIVFTSILLPLILKKKELALKTSMSLLFILWGLQYNATCDWPGTIDMWNNVTRYIQGAAERGTREYEPLFIFLVRTFKFLGFYGWLILCAIFDISVFYWLIKKFVSPNLYWLAIFIFILRIDMCLLFINSNRQTLSLVFVLISYLIILNETNKKKITAFKYIASFAFIYAATQIHTAAIVAYISIPLYIFINHYKNISRRNTIILLFICNIIFWGRYLFEINTSYFDAYMQSDSMSGYSGYLEQMNLNQRRSIPETIIYCIVMNTIILFISRMDKKMRFFACLSIIGILTIGYMFENLKRAMQYFYICLIIVIPYVVQLLRLTVSHKYRFIYQISCFLVILFCLYSFITGIRSNLIYCKWHDFQTILNHI